MEALYALARIADDIVDSREAEHQRAEHLRRLRETLAAGLASSAADGGSGDTDGAALVLPAVIDAVERFAIPPRYLFDLLDGVAMDLAPRILQTFAELRQYCLRVASAVGLACLPIWGCRDERAIPPAIDCGIAFQLTNILRDLKEDAERGRCYLPQDELERFGIRSGHRAPTAAVAGAPPGREDQAAAQEPWRRALERPRDPPEAWLEFIGFQVARAKTYYDSAANTAHYLPPAGRRVFLLMLARYRAILAAIEREPGRILRERVKLSMPRKAVVAVRALLASPKSRRQSPTLLSARRPLHHALSTATPALPAYDRERMSLELPSVAIAGGGLAGLAAAVALCQRGFRVELFEARQRLGGRAGSYVDRSTGGLVDHCQHVAMGCCTSFLDFCRQTGTLDHFTCHRTLHFIGPEAERIDFRAAPLLPAPLHLFPALVQSKYLSLKDRLAIAAGLLRLARMPPLDQADSPTIGQWLAAQGQSPAAVEHFWQVVLVSALGESLDRASVAAARKVFVDGFLSHRRAYEVYVPQVPLGELYDVKIADWLRKRGVTIHLGSPVERVGLGGERPESVIRRGESRGRDQEPGAGSREPERGRSDWNKLCVATKDGTKRQFDFVIAALPWRRLPEVLAPELAQALDEVVRATGQIESSPITGIHLWFDRPITELPHAVLVGRLAQWMFAKPMVSGLTPAGRGQDAGASKGGDVGLHYYQVVISASRSLAGRDREAILGEVLGDLHAVFPESRQARLVCWRMVTEQEAVISVRPGLDELRPDQQTAIPAFFVAGDWTATGWPSTMEGAVRSGFLAAEALLRSLGRPLAIAAAGLSRAWLARLLTGLP
jgi:phytoene/squalene synthetase/uncharacterized protein with NAD-binding domain and iron-sulfur cluster